MAAQVTGRPAAECEQLLGEIERLGWSNLYVKTLVIGAFARYCLNLGHRALGRQHLAPLVDELARAHATPPADWCRDALETLRPLLDELQR